MGEIFRGGLTARPVHPLAMRIARIEVRAPARTRSADGSHFPQPAAVGDSRAQGSGSMFAGIGGSARRDAAIRENPMPNVMNEKTGGTDVALFPPRRSRRVAMPIRADAGSGRSGGTRAGAPGALFERTAD